MEIIQARAIPISGMEIIRRFGFLRYIFMIYIEIKNKPDAPAISEKYNTVFLLE